MVRDAVSLGARVIVSTYNEPLITSEWAVAVFKEAKAAGLVDRLRLERQRHAAGARVPAAVGRSLQGRSQELRRSPLSPARRAPRADPRHDPAPARDGLLARDRDAADPRLQRFARRARAADGVRRRRLARHPVARDGVPRRLQDDRSRQHDGRHARRTRPTSATPSGLRYVYAGNLPGSVGDSRRHPLRDLPATLVARDRLPRSATTASRPTDAAPTVLRAGSRPLERALRRPDGDAALPARVALPRCLSCICHNHQGRAEALPYRNTISCSPTSSGARCATSASRSRTGATCAASTACPRTSTSGCRARTSCTSRKSPRSSTCSSRRASIGSASRAANRCSGAISPTLVQMLAGKPGLNDLALTTNGVLLADQVDALAGGRPAPHHRQPRHAARRPLQGAHPLRRARARARGHGRRKARVRPRVQDRHGRHQGRQRRRARRSDRVRKDDARRGPVHRIHGRRRRHELVARRRRLARRDARAARRALRARSTPIVEESSAPADRFALPDGTTFGIISSTTEPFCSNCDRSRLTADGMWYLCLYADAGHRPARAAARRRVARSHRRHHRRGLGRARPIAAPRNASRSATAARSCRSLRSRKIPTSRCILEEVRGWRLEVRGWGWGPGVRVRRPLPCPFRFPGGRTRAATALRAGLST